jgi:hypothetical protein
MQVINWRQVKRMYRKLTHLSPSVRIELENEHRPEINTANSHERRQRNTQAGICRFCFKKNGIYTICRVRMEASTSMLTGDTQEQATGRY